MTDTIFSMLESYRLRLHMRAMDGRDESLAAVLHNINKRRRRESLEAKLSSRSIKRKISPAEEGNSEHDEHGDPKVEGCNSSRVQKINTDRSRTLRVCAILSK